MSVAVYLCKGIIMEKHIFAICAYGESKYLEECILSLKAQTVKTKIICATSTPNKHIEGLCEEYDIPLFINTGEHGITQDWNFAYRNADAEYVTLAHQDDIYCPEYVRNIVKQLSEAKDPIIAFTDYGELRNGKHVDRNTLLKIKRILLFPLRTKLFWNRIWIRRRILSLGSPICCPSVTFVKENCPKEVFRHRYRSDEDWEAWEMLSKRRGAFVFCSKILMYHRIHEESETTKIIQDSGRTWEDREMFSKFWPAPIAGIITKLYGASEKSNKL